MCFGLHKGKCLGNGVKFYPHSLNIFSSNFKDLKKVSRWHQMHEKLPIQNIQGK